jgi:hypothetical protein
MDYKLDKALTSSDYDEIITVTEGECGTVLAEAGKGDELHLYKAAAYIGKAGISITGLTGALSSGDDAMSTISSLVNGPVPMLNLGLALDEYALVTNGLNCDDSSISSIAKTSCTVKSFIGPMQALSTMSVLAGNSMTYNGQEVTAMSALMNPSSVGIKDDGTQTEFDVDGNGTLDSSQATGMAMNYGVDDANNTGIGTNLEGADPKAVTFTKGSNTYKYQLIKVTISSKDGDTSKDAISYQLISGVSPDNTNNFTSVADGRTSMTISGFCDTSFVKCDGYSAGSCYPCPVIQADGDAMPSTTAVADTLNSSDDPQMEEAKNMLDCNSNGIVEDAEVAYYMANSSCENYQ